MIEAMKRLVAAVEAIPEEVEGWMPDALTDALIDARQAIAEAEKQEPVGKLKVTLEDRPIDIELAQYKRMFEAACSALGEVSEALGCDPNEGGSEPLIAAIERLKSSSQEPIAWMVYTLDGKSAFVTDNPTDFTDEHRALPLYTHLQPKEWVGLTDDEQIALLKDSDGKTRHWLVWQVEAKLKEKNGY